MKLEESMVGKYSKVAGTCSESVGTSLMFGKYEILIKMRGGGKSGIGIIMEFHGILSRFPNQG